MNYFKLILKYAILLGILRGEVKAVPEPAPLGERVAANEVDA